MRVGDRKQRINKAWPNLKNGCTFTMDGVYIHVTSDAAEQIELIHIYCHLHINCLASYVQHGSLMNA